MLKAPRFRIRPPQAQPAQTLSGPTAADLGIEHAPRPVAAPPAPKLTVVKTRAQTPSPSLLEPEDDGFGPGVFATARGEVTPPQDPSADAELDAIRREGLTGRQLRLARRMAEKNNIAMTSDYDAVRQLRRAGLDPFGRSSVLDMVAAAAGGAGGDGNEGGSRALTTGPQPSNLPQTSSPMQLPSAEVRTEAHHISEVQRIQRDIARRRRQKTLLLWIRLSIFVGLPTLLAALYFTRIATPMYSTKSEFVIQQAQNGSATGLGSLFSGTQFATSQDSIAVQGYLQSRDAMLRLDSDVGFRTFFADPKVDALQRLEDPNSIEAAYKIYQKYIKISYDPTEGIIKMESSAPDPDLSAAWSSRLIAYAEEQVNHLSERLRSDQMKGASESYAEAERRLMDANERVVLLQEQNSVLSSEVEVGLLTSQITTLETQLTQERLALAQMLSNANPNRARVDPVQRRITTLGEQIDTLRSRLTEGGVDGRSLARIQSELLVAEADVGTRQLLMTQAAQQLESARIEANRQQRYLSLSVAPVAPDVASYPRAFENTAVAFLIFAGIYLMLALTASILREQVST